MRRAAVLAVALVALLFAVSTAREIARGRAAVADADAAIAKGDTELAIARARDAAEAAAAGSPYVRPGYDRLETLARTAEARGDERTALEAWGAMRAASAATAGPLGGSEAWSALADDGIARVGAGPTVPTGEVHATTAAIRAELEKEDAPSWVLLTLLGAGALTFFAGTARLAVVAGGPLTLKGVVTKEAWALAATALGAVVYTVVCLRG